MAPRGAICLSGQPVAAAVQNGWSGSNSGGCPSGTSCSRQACWTCSPYEPHSWLMPLASNRRRTRSVRISANVTVSPGAKFSVCSLRGRRRMRAPRRFDVVNDESQGSGRNRRGQQRSGAALVLCAGQHLARRAVHRRRRHGPKRALMHRASTCASGRDLNPPAGWICRPPPTRRR